MRFNVKKLGANYLTPQMLRWHKNDLENRMYITTVDGKKVSMPRYYKEKIYSDAERDIIAKATAKKISEQQIKQWETLSPEQLKINAHNKAELIIHKHREQLTKKLKGKL